MPGCVRSHALAFSLAMLLGLSGVAASRDLPAPELPRPRLTDAPADPELIEWAGSRDARRSEFRWSLDPGAGYDVVREELLAALGIDAEVEPRYRTIEFFDRHGILAEQGRLLRVRRTFSDDSFTKLRSADVTLKVRGEDEALVRSQVESLWRSAGRKKSRAGHVPWCLASGRSCKLEWDMTSGGTTRLAFSMKRKADDEKEIRARVARVAELAGAPEPTPLCQRPAQELSWSAVVEMDGECPSDVAVDFAWWHQGPGRTHAMEISVQTDDARVVDFVTRKIAHLAASRPSSKTASYLEGCRP